MNINEEKLKAFVNDTLMFEVVKKFLLSETEVDYSEIAKEFPDNENLGAKTRALAEGRAFIEKGFHKLLEYQKNDIIINKKNRAI